MAAADVFNFGDFDLVFEDTLNSGTFVGFCGIQQAEWDRSADISTTMIPDCDPEAPGTPRHFEKSRSATFTGSGTVDAASMVRLNAWWAAKAKRNVRMFRDVSGARGGGYYQGLAILTNIKETGGEHDTWKFSISIMFDGEPSFTASA